MARGEGPPLTLVIHGMRDEPSAGELRAVIITTNRGDILGRYYPVEGASRGAVWVGGVGGGWDTPAQGLYPRLCGELQEAGIASLRVRFRRPGHLAESLLDVLAGLEYLRSEGVKRVALTGHSFGGAIVVQAGVQSELARTVITLATQSFGAGDVHLLAPERSILLVHGADDHVLPPSASEYVHHHAGEPKRLVLLAGAGHGLDEAAEEVHRLVREWIVQELSPS